jgi:hypothetical protein
MNKQVNTTAQKLSSAILADLLFNQPQIPMNRDELTQIREYLAAGFTGGFANCGLVAPLQ